VLRRAVDSAVTLFFIFLLNFFLFFTKMEEYSGMTQTDQFVAYLKFVFIDHFGKTPAPDSLPTMDFVLSRLSPTLSILVYSVLLVFLFSLLFGAVASYKHGKFPDLLITSVLVFICMIPAWWLGLVTGKTVINTFKLNAYNPYYELVKYSILPTLTIFLCLCGIFFLIVRNSMVNIFPEKYITLAKAKGVSVKSLLFKHAMRNALLAITAMIALAPFLVVNQIVPIERVFQVRGVGDLLYTSIVSIRGIERIPTPTVQVIFLTLATVMVAGHFILDIVQHILDPRLKYPTKVADGGLVRKLRRKTMSRKKRLAFFFRNFKKGKIGLIGLAILSFFVAIALLAPFLPIADPDKQFVPVNNPKPPDVSLEKILSYYFFTGNIRIRLVQSAPLLPSHWLGIDDKGRDVFSRVIWGAWASLFEGITTTLIAMSFGCLVGLLAGYYQGRWFAYILDRITEVFLSMPILVFIIFFPLEIGETYYDIRAVLRWILAIGLATWAITAKLVKSQVILSKEKPYIEAARAMGANDRHIIWHYILPDAIPVMASSVLYIATIVLAMQSTLDFFGYRRFVYMGHDPGLPALTDAPYVSWGTLLSYGTLYQSLTLNWWMIVPPAFCIALLGLSMVLICNKVADALNPEL
jgi:peptide/nickel transport system permease protein